MRIQTSTLVLAASVRPRHTDFGEQVDDIVHRARVAARNRIRKPDSFHGDDPTGSMVSVVDAGHGVWDIRSVWELPAAPNARDWTMAERTIRRMLVEQLRERGGLHRVN